MTYSPVLATSCADPRLSFESFVCSEETAAAVDFARRIVRREIDCTANPVCFVAESGMGKTHLLSAISNASTMNTLMVDTVDLIREHQIATDSGRLADFRLWILSWDLLLMDDVHHCQRNAAFQRELPVLFDRAARNNCLLVTTCDKSPADTEACDRSVISRFHSGVTLGMNMPALEARRSILQHAVGTKSLSTEQLTQIADKVDTNIRELKAAARQLVMSAETTGRPITGADIERVTRLFRRRDLNRSSDVGAGSWHSSGLTPMDRRNPAFFEEILSLAGSVEERSLALQIILLEKLRRIRADTEGRDSREIGDVQATLRLLREHKLGEAMQMIKPFVPDK